ncbi:enoyl-CoA hydratase/isomerase family protein [Breoghania sp. L-A4]|uniref:enoyl-CoA hydratase/isomerase family protein n=1 Tax=Breoghania sp. L-A4 TaxID=2304600 RepID=UPI0013C2CD92|nr:enoyl-CoA hydratase/isomerase family protein [Breoghania sp. L-A4]
MLRTGTFGPALHLTLDRPEAGNALNEGLLAALDTALAANAAPAIVLDGAGSAFCTGLDLAELRNDAAETPPYERFARILDTLASAPALTIAVVDGDAFGGGLALACACDVVVATKTSRFALPEALWGLLPALAAPVVARRAGLAATRRLALTTEPVNAVEALRLGLADHVVADRAAAEGIARRQALRAARTGADALSSVKALFGRLERDPETYRAFALREIAARGASEAVRTRIETLSAAKDLEEAPNDR